MKIIKKGYYRFLEDHSVEGMRFPGMYRYNKGSVIKIIDIEPSSEPSKYGVVRIDGHFGFVHNRLPVQEVEITKKKEPVKEWILVGTHRIEVDVSNFAGGFCISLYVDGRKIGHFLNNGKLIIHPEQSHKFKVMCGNDSQRDFTVTFFIYEYILNGG